MEKVINLDNVDQYNNLYGLETLHPLVSVVDLTKATRAVNQIQMHYGVYALFLKLAKTCDIKYGRQSYDYQEGTIVCFAPGQTISVSTVGDQISQPVYGLVFHPDLIHGTSLGKTIKNYTFFSYAVHEALHLSDQEKETVMDCLKKISIELEHPIDKHSKSLIAMNIELLLNYCMRFYERQFITRCEANKLIIRQTSILLDEYIQSEKLKKGILPSVEYCAGKLHLSTHYFSDLLYFETGQNIHEYFQFKRLEASKTMLLKQGYTAGTVAEKLGYPNVQQFSRIFKKITGIAPSDYRVAQN